MTAPLDRARELADAIGTGDDVALPLVSALALVSIAESLARIADRFDRVTRDDGDAIHTWAER